MSSDYAVCIEVDNSRKIVNGLSRTATVGEVVEKLRVSCGKKTPQLLLESWRGCSRVMASEEKLCISFEQWGSQARDVELIMAEARRYNRKTAVRKSRRGRGCSGKVAWRKSVGLERKKAKIVRCVNKRHSIHLVRQLEEDVTRLKEEIAYHEPIENALSSHDHMSNVSGYLPPELREEYSEVMQNADDQHQVTTELLQHRAELRQKVTTKQNEKMALEKIVDELHKKVISITKKNTLTLIFNSYAWIKAMNVWCGGPTA